METNNIMQESDEMNFVIENYGKFIKETLGTNEIAISFFANSENYVDKIEPIRKPNLFYEDMKILIYQDFSLEKELLTDCNLCIIGDKKFVKIITPFTRERTYDFIIAKYDELEWILKELHIRQEKANFTSVNLPIIGLNFFDNLKKETIEFLLNEDFRKFCIEHRIPLKRGILLEGKPGTGKTLSLKWLKEQALKNKIEFHVFKSPKEFAEERERYYSGEKKIFVFEDFDAALLERKKTGDTPSTILASVLNTLEGIDEIKDVVSVFTTNFIHNFDSAFIRPGRIDRVLRYNLPTDEQRQEFLDAYLQEFGNEDKNFILGVLQDKQTDISFAILKGVCDDVNIYNFNKKFVVPEGTDRNKFTFGIFKEIIETKLAGANKGDEAKDAKKYIM
jgi:ATPase family associated with various cellular activities (AAA)